MDGPSRNPDKANFLPKRKESSVLLLVVIHYGYATWNSQKIFCVLYVSINLMLQIEKKEKSEFHQLKEFSTQR